ncbi:MAG: dihydroorotate dehydrogenase electron transfer subunit [Paludibacteraceae bacterium]|nr:dihydroorotate dehydrogenase electron transfer subunit [Paludibacteraceae bacterium]
MKQSKWTIVSNTRIACRTYLMQLQGDTSAIRPGQFVEIEVPGCYLRRPISVCNIEGDILTIIYKVVGQGTAQMAQMPKGEELDILSGLGNGYDLTKAGQEVLLIGGGVGVPPLVFAAKRLREAGKSVRVVMGFNTADEVFAEKELMALGCRVDVCTMDGSYGTKGVVTDMISTPAPYYYACGPLPMLRAVTEQIGTNGQISMEERMGCGVGICVGCSIETKQGIKRVCVEGPVFDAEDLKI